MRWSDFFILRLCTAVIMVWASVVVLWQIYQQRLNNFEQKPQATPINLSRPAATIQIQFVGDLMFDRDIRQQASRHGNDFIFEPIAELLRQSDVVLANLEGPITDNKTVSVGTTPNMPQHFRFTFPIGLAQTLASHRINIVNLGNNHGLNFGVAGVRQTTTHLNDAGVSYFGYLDGAQDFLDSVLVLEKHGFVLGFVNFNQFSSQTIEMAVESIQQLASTTDFIVVYTHWDNEYQRLPAARSVSSAHQFIDAGADLVIGTHPHVIQSIETYHQGKIYYSLGNFVFDQYFEPAVRSGLLVQLTLKKTSDGVIEPKYQEQYLALSPNGQTTLNLSKTASQSAKINMQ